MTTEHHSMDVIEPVSQSTSDLPTLEIPLDETNDYLEREYRGESKFLGVKLWLLD